MVTTTTAERVARSVSQAIVTADRSKAWVAQATGIPYSTLGRKLLGRSEFNFSELLLIAEVLGVSPARFVPAEFGETAAAS